MVSPALTDRIISQGRAIVRAIEALGTIERLGTEIDALVHELYGLTDGEIAVVEGRLQETASQPICRQG
jgi:hypothetical protein